MIALVLLGLATFVILDFFLFQGFLMLFLQVKLDFAQLFKSCVFTLHKITSRNILLNNTLE